MPQLPNFPRVEATQLSTSLEWVKGGVYFVPHENCVQRRVYIPSSMKSSGVRSPISWLEAVTASKPGECFYSSSIDNWVMSPRFYMVSIWSRWPE